jgi:hypothetical protein
MLSPRVVEGHQIPLIREVHADDRFLLNTLEGKWFEILYAFPWEDYRLHAAAYYEALYEFNLSENQLPVGKRELPETKEQARQRLLFDRATMQEAPTQIIYEGPVVQRPVASVDPMALAPGVVPIRLAGRKPKCFFSLLKSFIGTTLMGFPAEPESVYLLLKSNPSFARVCGFVLKEKAKPEAYDARQIPTLRKLEQFDQVMRQGGIWEQIKVSEVKTNLLTGVIKKESEVRPGR